MPEPERSPSVCTVCKGTGFVPEQHLMRQRAALRRQRRFTKYYLQSFLLLAANSA